MTNQPLLFITEGDANTWNSWSGCSHGLLNALRSLGCTVTTADASLRRLPKLASIGATFTPDRRHWAARHHYGPIGFHVRSARARRAARRHPAGAPILQTGATFAASPVPSESFFMFCDANCVFGREAGKKRSAALTDREFRAMVERERAVYERAATIFTMSECLRQSFISDFGIAPERVVTVHAGVNMRHVPPAVSHSPRAADPTILFVGKEFHRKGGDILVAAFERVRRAIPTARLVIAGSNPPCPPIPGLEIKGFISRETTGPGSLSALYAAADLFCMPSLYEPFGVVFVEAMMHGLPCIGTTEWAMPEIIDHGVTGWLAPPRDVEGLAGTLIAGLSDRGRLREMGARARRVAQERFTWERVASIMLGRMYGERTASGSRLAA